MNPSLYSPPSKVALEKHPQCGFKCLLSSVQLFTLKISIWVRYLPSDKLQSLIPFKTSIFFYFLEFYKLMK